MKIINNKSDKLLKILLFLVSPFISFLYSLRNIKSKSSYVVFFLFCVFFGMSFTVNNDYSGDGIRYINKFLSISTYDNSEYFDLLNTYAEFDEGDKDFYFITMSFVVSRITNNYHILFAIFAAIFAFFQLKSLRFLTNETQFTDSIVSFILAVMFIMSNCIFNINGVRFWTAAWVGVYCIFQIFRNNNKKYFILACITPLIHVSFFVYLFIIFIAYFTKKYERMWIVIFFFSFVFSQFSIGIISGLEQYFPTFISKTIQVYTDQQYINSRLDETVWYFKVFKLIENFIVNLIMVLIIRNRKLIKTNTPHLVPLYLFSIVWLSVVNFTIAVPSLGGRFFQLSIPIFAYLWLMIFKNVKYKIVPYFWVVCFSYSLLAMLNNFTKVTELEFYIYNPFYLIYHYILI